MSMRTKSGGVSATARKKRGMKSKTAKKGSFPIFDTTSAKSALRLRGHAKSKTDRESILKRASKYVPSAAKAARKRDRAAGKI